MELKATQRPILRGSTKRLHISDNFTLVPGKKVVWRVLDNYFDFTEDKSEWKDTEISFEIARKGDKTEVRFAHLGLVPEYECFDVCSNACGSYINGSLRSLITTGKGKPTPRE